MAASAPLLPCRAIALRPYAIEDAKAHVILTYEAWACAGSRRVLILDDRAETVGRPSAPGLGEDKGDSMYTPTLAAPVFAVGFDHAATAAKTEATVSQPATRPRPLRLHPV
jgi:hypothetical protein